MNREIKFRAWDKTRNRIVVVPEFHFGDDGGALTVIVWDKTIEGFDNAYVVGESCELMQFTGLKDKNGKEIYEGDLVKGGLGNYQPYTIVWWHAGWHIADKFLLKRRFPMSIRFEVIGNVYENPELLKS